MSEMNRVARWFVNHVRGPANARLYGWLSSHLVLPPEAICLEVGCGNANMAVRILGGMGPKRLVATDLDPKQIEEAQRYASGESGGPLPDGLELRIADLNRLPFPDRGFDAVFAFASIHHASPHHRDHRNVPTALGEIDRVLRPGGFLVYEEFLHRRLIREWLSGRGYAIVASSVGWRRDRIILQKPAGVASGPTPGPW